MNGKNETGMGEVIRSGLKLFRALHEALAHVDPVVAVSDGADLYELAYNTASQLWSLAAVEEGGRGRVVLS